MILSVLAISLHFALATQILLADSMPLQEPIKSVIPYNVNAMPIAINTAVAEGSWLTYSVTNKSAERIEDIDLRVFIVDERGKLIGIEESSHLETINAGVTQESRAYIRIPIKENSRAVVVVTRAVGQSGVWTVDLSEVKRAVAESISGRSDTSAKVVFEQHVQVSAADRARIFSLILDDFLHDNSKADRAGRVKDRANIVVLSDNVEFDLPQIPNVSLSKLDKEEIQKLADEKGRVFYLIYRPLVVEGARVMARLSLRDERARRPGAHIPYKFTYLFTLTKKDSNWTIEKSLGYAQS